MSKQKMMERFNLTDEDFKPTPLAQRVFELERQLATVNAKLQQIDSHQFEVIKPSFDADNPIPYVDGMELVNNAFYLKDGKTYVWMNEWVEW